MENEIVNRVAASSLITFDLEELYPAGEISEIDLKSILYQGLILREKDLRDFIKAHDWRLYEHKNVAIFCSEDAVIPTWAYMLLGIALEPYASKVVFGNKTTLLETLYKDALDKKVDWAQYKDAKVVIKGCSDAKVPESAYLETAVRLRSLASSILYGEPCSTVPLYKKPK